MKDTSKLWDKRYQELLSYKMQKGDTNVPRRYESNPQLGVWVSNQRQYYKKFKTGISGWGMTESRIKRLENIGFEWVLAGGRVNVGCHNNNVIVGDSTGDDSKPAATLLEWDKMYDKLVAYKHLYGNVNVPEVYVDDQNLADWVTTQKHGIKRYMSGMKCNGMTFDRFQLLLKVGLQNSIIDDGADENEDKMISDLELAMDNSSKCTESGLNDSRGELHCRTIPIREGITLSPFGTTANKRSFDEYSEKVNDLNENNDETREEDNIFFEAIAASGSGATLDSIAEIIYQKFSTRNSIN
eukprot:CAMPEP_0203665384 /NCGR_PEP_ID=MMETSP0090-20130426/2596_1 /ASSEMBLY_ACC=CAM_ASM_001088 /TAXON_ID=426623 /ORGANISM="Chaetoceros affinis, Strain CCMP159" /LENGTH=297 /DNA_ID=CAMNT_0050528905 /DNA_START=44 /DNA_END=937 /DNA_ORIENTATION=+